MADIVPAVPEQESVAVPTTTSSDMSNLSEKVSAIGSVSVGGKPTEGKIALEIGTGDEAKDSFVYLIIRWSFLVGSISSAALFIKGFFACVGSFDGVEMFKGVWSVLLPVITLALGYAFGKGR